MLDPPDGVAAGPNVLVELSGVLGGDLEVVEVTRVRNANVTITWVELASSGWRQG